jgi:hypothetical protein
VGVVTFPMASRSVRLLALFAVAGSVPLAVPGCGARTGLDVPAPAPCVISSHPPGMMHACDGGTTSISGTVYDPAARRPLYAVVVYVPSATPQPIVPGASCGSCDALYTGNPIATTLTDADGNFTLSGVPDGANIPLVLQVGKWRRQLTLATVLPCQDNPQPDRSLTMPRNHTEGDLPSIAVSTGSADTLECLFLRVGLDAAEYGGGPDGPGRIHIFQGSPGPGPGGPGPGGPGGPIRPSPNTSPPGPSSAAALWDSDADILPYDMVFLSCEGAETKNMNQQVLFDYAAAGGRVFASHFQYAWFDTGPFGQASLATWKTGSNSIGDIDADIVTTLSDGQPFPQGVALAHWLATTGSLVGGELPIEAARHNADVGPANPASQAWIVADQNTLAPDAAEYFSFSTPLGAAAADQCGQVVFTDMHVGAASGDDQSLPVPAECADVDLSPQERALEFVVFNLSSCVTPPGQTPTPPAPCVRAKE